MPNTCAAGAAAILANNSGLSPIPTITAASRPIGKCRPKDLFSVALDLAGLPRNIK